MTKRFTLVHIALFLCLVLPHSLLNFYGVYQGKLRVDMMMDEEFLVGVFCMGLFVVVFLGAAKLARIDRAAVAELTLRLEKRPSFRAVCLAITLLCFALLAFGIGMKQSESSSNFIIRMIPREVVLVAATLCAVVTRRMFWIVLLLANMLYWMLVGSKAALFLAVVAFAYYHTFERLPVKASHLLVVGVSVVLLPVTFLIPFALRAGISPSDIIDLLVTSPEYVEQTLGRIAGRVSWLDGMHLTLVDVAPLANFGIPEFLGVALAKLLPGVAPPTEPFGQQIIYLYQAQDLVSFSGAIGMPGVFKVMLYNHGLIYLLLLAGLVGLTFYVFFRMVSSRDPVIMVMGVTLMVVSFTSLAISGNIDSALAKLIPLLATGIFFLLASRLLFLHRN